METHGIQKNSISLTFSSKWPNTRMSISSLIWTLNPTTKTPQRDFWWFVKRAFIIISFFQFDQGSLGLGFGSRDYYMDKKKFFQQLQAYRELMIQRVRRGNWAGITVGKQSNENQEGGTSWAQRQRLGVIHRPSDHCSPGKKRNSGHSSDKKRWSPRGHGKNCLRSGRSHSFWDQTRRNYGIPLFNFYISFFPTFRSPKTIKEITLACTTQWSSVTSSTWLRRFVTLESDQK